MTITRDMLLIAIVDAHEAAYSEYMACPWCGGHIGAGDERHEDFGIEGAACIWLLAMDEIKQRPELLKEVRAEYPWLFEKVNE